MIDKEVNTDELESHKQIIPTKYRRFPQPLSSVSVGDVFLELNTETPQNRTMPFYNRTPNRLRQKLDFNSSKNKNISLLKRTPAKAFFSIKQHIHQTQKANLSAIYLKIKHQMENARKVYQKRRKMKCVDRGPVYVRSLIKNNRQQVSVSPRAVSPTLIPIKREMICISVQGIRNN